MLYRVYPAWVGFEFTSLVVIGTDCMGSCKSNYHKILTKMVLLLQEMSVYIYICTIFAVHKAPTLNNPQNPSFFYQLIIFNFTCITTGDASLTFPIGHFHLCITLPSASVQWPPFAVARNLKKYLEILIDYIKRSWNFGK
jgi:hypothetical protein